MATVAAWIAFAIAPAACDESAPDVPRSAETRAAEARSAEARSAETRAAEAKAGDFLEYYDEVLRLARRYAAEPDSFRTALTELPGSHLTEEEWDAWTEPYAQDPVHLASHVERLLAELASQ
jgi:hypothetical protein